jgi:hypothetical protein
VYVTSEAAVRITRPAAFFSPDHRETSGANGKTPLTPLTPRTPCKAIRSTRQALVQSYGSVVVVTTGEMPSRRVPFFTCSAMPV